MKPFTYETLRMGSILLAGLVTFGGGLALQVNPLIVGVGTTAVVALLVFSIPYPEEVGLYEEPNQEESI